MKILLSILLAGTTSYAQFQALPKVNAIKLEAEKTYFALVGADEFCRPRELNLGQSTSRTGVEIYSQGEATNGETSTASSVGCDQVVQWPMSSGVVLIHPSKESRTLKISLKNPELSTRMLFEVLHTKPREVTNGIYEGGNGNQGRKYILVVEKKGSSKIQNMNIAREYTKSGEGQDQKILESFQITDTLNGEPVDPAATQRATFVVDLWVPTYLAAKNGAKITEIKEVTALMPVDIEARSANSSPAERTVARFYDEVINGHSNNSLNEILSESFVDHTPYCENCTRDNFRDFNSAIIQLIPDVFVNHHVTSLKTLSDGSSVVSVVGSVRGTVKGFTPMFGERLGQASWIEDHKYIVKNNKIAEHWVSIRNSNIK